MSFRYAARAPNVIEDVSFRIRQGEYVAFVGPSGCGKSTIYRLLLGFEQPTSGSVFLDGHDLSGLDMVAVRQRMGVVLQNGYLVAGSIYENIAGMTPLSTHDAWTAARAAALEEDIRAMPMEMRTVVPADGAGLSVGQKQRLLIARALARRPRVLLFDEATSALDNRAQAVVQAQHDRNGRDPRRDRPPAQLHPRRRPYLRARPRADRRDRHLRRAHRPRRHVRCAYPPPTGAHLREEQF